MADKQTKNDTINTNLYILKALESGEKYGYEIIDSVNKISYNKLEIKQATLYANLKRLEQKKLINSYWKDSDIGGKRHYYFITDAGRKFLAESNYNFSSFDEIINEELNKEPKKDSSIELIDANSLNSKDSKAFWSENKFLASKIIQKEQDNAINKIIQQQNKANMSDAKNAEEKPINNNYENDSVSKSAKILESEDKNEPENNLSDCEDESISSVGSNIKHTASATIYLSNNQNANEANEQEKLQVKQENYKDTNAGRKYDAVILGQDEKIESIEEAYSMQNRPLNSATQTTDIDYKNILGELYSDKESFYARNNSHKNENSKNAVVGEYNNSQQGIESYNNLNASEAVNAFNCNENFEGENNFEQFNDVNDMQNKAQQQIKLKTIANNFANYKIKVKSHNKLYKIDLNSDDFIKANKLNFVSSVLNYAFFALLMVISGFCLSNSQIESFETVLKICLGLGAVYPIITLVIYLINSEKKAKNNFNFKNTTAITALSCLVVMVFIIAVCLLCGMTNLNQAKYIYFWLIPAIIFISIIAYFFIKELLIKSKKFNC